MLGEIVNGLTDAATAGDVAAAIARPDMLARIRDAAVADGVAIGSLVATRIRHVVEHGGEDIWLDLLGLMAGSPQPGAAAVERMLAYAFPDPVRVRLSRADRRSS